MNKTTKQELYEAFLDLIKENDFDDEQDRIFETPEGESAIATIGKYEIMLKHSLPVLSAVIYENGYNKIEEIYGKNLENLKQEVKEWVDE